MTATTFVVVILLALVAWACFYSIRALAQAFRDADEWQREQEDGQ